jgi:hypothetical protein
MLNPRFIAKLNGLPLRLFGAPPPRRQMPWPCFDDLTT